MGGPDLSFVSTAGMPDTDGVLGILNIADELMLDDAMEVEIGSDKIAVDTDCSLHKFVTCAHCFFRKLTLRR